MQNLHMESYGTATHEHAREADKYPLRWAAENKLHQTDSIANISSTITRGSVKYRLITFLTQSSPFKKHQHLPAIGRYLLICYLSLIHTYTQVEGLKKKWSWVIKTSFGSKQKPSGDGEREREREGAAAEVGSEFTVWLCGFSVCICFGLRAFREVWVVFCV